ncbi:MAG: RNA polymerase sigma factor [Armatimonadota bacterium]
MTLDRRPDIAASAEMMNEDEILSRKIAAGDTGAWDDFFDRYAPWAYRFAYHHLNANHADAEDLCSDIMLTAAKSIGKYDPKRGDLDAWLHGIARNRLAHFCRARHIEEPLTEEFCISETALPDLKYAVNRALADLPKRQADALISKYVEGYTTDELAQRTGSTTKAVESLLVRARTAFRTAFGKLMADDPGGDNHEQQ